MSVIEMGDLEEGEGGERVGLDLLGLGDLPMLEVLRGSGKHPNGTASRVDRTTSIGQKG